MQSWRYFARKSGRRAKLYSDGALGVVTAGLVALVGFMVLTAALVSSLNTRIGNLPLSCLIIGGAYFVVGAGTAVGLAKHVTGRPLPKTQIELEKDKEWIKQQTNT